MDLLALCDVAVVLKQELKHLEVLGLDGEKDWRHAFDILPVDVKVNQRIMLVSIVSLTVSAHTDLL